MALTTVLLVITVAVMLAVIITGPASLRLYFVTALAAIGVVGIVALAILAVG